MTYTVKVRLYQRAPLIMVYPSVLSMVIVRSNCEMLARFLDVSNLLSNSLVPQESGTVKLI